MKIVLKRTSKAESKRMASGRVCYFPSNYDIFADGEKVGSLYGFTQTKLRDGGHGHRGTVKGQKLTWASPRGEERHRMETEIKVIMASQ